MKTTIRLVIVLALTGLVFGCVFGWDWFVGSMTAKYMKMFANPVQTISTVTAAAEPWQPHIEAVGSLRAMNGADLSSDTSGIVDEIDFKSGDDVAAGAVLLRLRTEDDAAHLQQLQSAASIAQINYQRDMKQLAAQAVSRSTVDNDLSTLRTAQAAVAQQQAANARKTIVAPFAGHLGIREVDVGQYVGAGTAIVTLQALDPIYVDFYVPQQDLAAIHADQAVQLKVDTFPDRVFPGVIEALNARVDAGTRTLQIRARVANADHALLPGMFATVDIESGAPQSYITLPQTALTYNPYGATAFLVKDAGGGKLTARQVFVTAGDTRGDQVAVAKGIAAGDVVVVAGQMKLRNGSLVEINNALLPADDPDPKPVDQ